jgi:hypothetical protein
MYNFLCSGLLNLGPPWLISVASVPWPSKVRDSLLPRLATVIVQSTRTVLHVTLLTFPYISTFSITHFKWDENLSLVYNNVLLEEWCLLGCYAGGLG